MSESNFDEHQQVMNGLVYVDFDAIETTDWHAMNAGLSSAAKSPLPELAKQILRDMGMNPDDVHRDLKRQVKQQKAKTRESLTVHLYHCNHLGTPVTLINEQGNIDWAIELDAWGNTVNEYHSNPSKPIEQPIRMQGQQLDKDSGLFYNRHRFYDPQLGRYVNQDPIGLAGGLNVYDYGYNAPNKFVDPPGLWATPAHNYFVGEAFQGLDPKLLESIKSGSLFADSSQFQDGDHAHMHAMSSDTLNPEQSKTKMCEYIKAKHASYIKKVWEGNLGGAFSELGMALHPVMDSTSPVHVGFQKWHGVFQDGHKHGPSPWSQESLKTAKTGNYRAETIRKMQAVAKGDFTCMGC